MQFSSQPPVRLYLFAHAGASSLAYRSWKAPDGLPLQLVGVDQPGRGPRLREPKTGDFSQLVDSMADFVIADLHKARQRQPDVRYATFGHSFGATMSLAVGAAVARTMGEAPAAAVLSAALPPHLQTADNTAHFTDRELLEKIVADGGTAPALLSNETMAKLLVQLMREDYAIKLQFHQAASLRVDYPLTLVAAEDDAHATPDQVWQWSRHSSAASRRVAIPGGHFAAVQQPEQVLALAAEDLWPGVAA